MSKGIADGTVGPWAREKLGALGEYLNFYTTALKNQAWLKGTTYVDAFAGSGTAKLRRRLEEAPHVSLFEDTEAVRADPEFDEFIRGSPRVALDLPNRFSRYVFIERDPGRASELEQLRQEYGDSYNIEVVRGEAAGALDALLDGNLGTQSSHRGIMFLDPFGMQVSWETIKRLAQTGRIEVVINFPLGMAIQRVLPRSGIVPPEWSASLDRFFGSHDWHSQVYRESTDLFNESIEKRKDAGSRLLEWYRGRLKDAFGHVSPAKLIRNTRGGHLYYLIWAGPHRLGLKGAHYILSKGENVT